MLSRTVLRKFEDAELQRLGQDGSIPHWIDKSFLETMKDDPQVAIAMLTAMRSVKSPAFDAVAPVTDAVAPAIVAVAPVTGAVAPVDAAAAPVIDAVAPVIIAVAPVTGAVAPVDAAAVPVIDAAVVPVSDAVVPGGDAVAPVAPKGTAARLKDRGRDIFLRENRKLLQDEATVVIEKRKADGLPPLTRESLVKSIGGMKFRKLPLDQLQIWLKFAADEPHGKRTRNSSGVFQSDSSGTKPDDLSLEELFIHFLAACVIETFKHKQSNTPPHPPPPPQPTNRKERDTHKTQHNDKDARNENNPQLGYTMTNNTNKHMHMCCFILAAYWLDVGLEETA